MTEQEKKMVRDLWNSGAYIYQIALLLPYKKYDVYNGIRELLTEGYLERRNIGDINAQKIVAAYARGASVRELALDFGFCEETIRRHLRSYGIAKNGSRKGKRKEQTDEIVELLMGGAKSSDVARKFGISRQRVHEIKKAYIEREKNND